MAISKTRNEEEEAEKKRPQTKSQANKMGIRLFFLQEEKNKRRVFLLIVVGFLLQ